MIILKTVNYLNEKGNPKQALRKGIKEQGVAFLESTLKENTENPVVRTERNTLSMQVASDENGDPIYLEIDAKVNQTPPDYKPERKSKSKKKDDENETVELF